MASLYWENFIRTAQEISNVNLLCLWFCPYTVCRLGPCWPVCQSLQLQIAWKTCLKRTNCWFVTRAIGGKFRIKRTGIVFPPSKFGWGHTLWDIYVPCWSKHSIINSAPNCIGIRTPADRDATQSSCNAEMKAEFSMCYFGSIFIHYWVRNINASISKFNPRVIKRNPKKPRGLRWWSNHFVELTHHDCHRVAYTTCPSDAQMLAYVLVSTGQRWLARGRDYDKLNSDKLAQSGKDSRAWWKVRLDLRGKLTTV